MKPSLTAKLFGLFVGLCASLAPAADGGYLFVTFKGEQTPLTEQIYFVTSPDGRNWTELNQGKPVLVSTIGTKGVRDPYLIRKPDGKYVLIATDLNVHLLNHVWKKAAQEGSQSIVIWESDDLVKWTEPRLAKIAAPDAGCTWAPEAVYDEQAGDYLVFWASANKSDDFKKFRIWAARTKDFKTFSDPFIYIERPYAVIDTSIVRENGTYYRFSKNEKDTLIFLETSKTLTGEWTLVENFSLAKTKGYEGPECYPLTVAADGKPAQWCLVMDHFTKGEGYKPFVTDDLASGEFKPAPDFKFPYRLRHGAVMPLTKEEMAKLVTAYGDRAVK